MNTMLHGVSGHQRNEIKSRNRYALFLQTHECRELKDLENKMPSGYVLAEKYPESLVPMATNSRRQQLHANAQTLTRSGPATSSLSFPWAMTKKAVAMVVAAQAAVATTRGLATGDINTGVCGR